MIRNSHNSRGSSTHPGNRVPHWRRVFMVLMLALSMESAGQTLPVQAAPTDETVNFSMVLVGTPKTTLCVGQSTTYHAKVELDLNKMAPTPAPAPPGSPKGLSVMNIKVEAFSGDTTVGDFTNAKNGTATANTTVVTDTDELSGLLVATFPFKANKKAGTTTLYFQGLVQGQYVSINLPVKVIFCKFQVSVDSKWNAGMTSVATMEGEIKSDGKGSFTDSANVNWVTSVLCGISSPIAPSTADMTGTISESGELTLKIAFGPASSAGGGVCKESVTTSNSMTFNTLTVNVPASFGGVSTQGLLGNANNGSFSGSATITVIPEEDTAAAFRPGSPQARGASASIMLAMLWNAFQGLRGEPSAQR